MPCRGRSDDVADPAIIGRLYFRQYHTEILTFLESTYRVQTFNVSTDLCNGKRGLDTFETRTLVDEKPRVLVFPYQRGLRTLADFLDTPGAKIASSNCLTKEVCE